MVDATTDGMWSRRLDELGRAAGSFGNPLIADGLFLDDLTRGVWTLE